jgi:hypothetical protein
MSTHTKRHNINIPWKDHPLLLPHQFQFMIYSNCKYAEQRVAEPIEWSSNLGLSGGLTETWVPSKLGPSQYTRTEGVRKHTAEENTWTKGEEVTEECRKLYNEEFHNLGGLKQGR